MGFFAITDYSSMLHRIGWATFFGWVLAIWTLNASFEPIRTVLPQETVKVLGTDYNVPSGVMFVAVAAAYLCRMLKLHDRLSDILGIRHRFDVKEILLPMGSAAGVALSLEHQATVKARRRQLMGEVFYKYASSTAKEPAIERHSITMALDQWSWYWIVLEASAVAVTTAVIAIWFGGFSLGFWLLIGVLVAQWFLLYLRTLCVRYAQEQIKQILGDPTRKRDIELVFRALHH